MPGFYAEVGENINTNISNFRDNHDIDMFSDHNYLVKRRTNFKFLNDKCFYQNDDFILVIEGIILNKYKFTKNAKLKSWSENILKLYQLEGEKFFSQLRGSFSGLLFDKKNKKWIIFTDHIGSNHIYYSTTNFGFVFSSEIKNIYDFFKKKNIKTNLNELSAYFLLTYGFMLEDYTLSCEIKKLLPGHYLIIDENKLIIKQYFIFSNTPDIKMTENDIIDEIDIQFRRSVKLQFEKDLEYGYNHLVALSGGLDSRMTSWVAHELGYTQQINLTFSQSDYLDEKIPKSISRDLKHEWIFKSLDNGLFLKDIDKTNIISGGNILYSGLAHANSILRLINFNELGLLHSGQIGDVIIGTYSKNRNKDFPFSAGDGAFSKKLLHAIPSFNFEMDYKNQEMFILYNRGFSGINYGLLLTQEYTETMSPFYDVELLEFALHIPMKYRLNHNIYFKWIQKKYPMAAKYKWEKIHTTINAPHFKFKNRNYYIVNIPKQISRKIKHILGVEEDYTNTSRHMNPLSYWLRTNLELKNYLDSYYNSNICELNKYPELKRDCEYLYRYGNAVEKNQVLTLLSSLNLFF